jgi:hypothetical protein
MVAVIHGQTAKVIQLSPEDAAQRKALEDQRTEIERKIKDFDLDIQRRYTTVLEGDKDASGYAYFYGISFGAAGSSAITAGCFRTLTTTDQAYEDCEKRQDAERAKNPPPPQRMYRSGWEQGVIYSDDFKFIVPAPAPVYKPAPYCGGIQLTN